MKVLGGATVTIKGTLSSTQQLPLHGEQRGEAYSIDKVLHVWDGNVWVQLESSLTKEESLDTREVVHLGLIDNPTIDILPTYRETDQEAQKRNEFIQEHLPWLNREREVHRQREVITNDSVITLNASFDYDKYNKKPDNVDKSKIFHLKSPNGSMIASRGSYPELNREIGFRLVNNLDLDRTFGRGYIFTGIISSYDQFIKISPIEPDVNRWKNIATPAPPIVTVHDIAYYWYI